ncbi:hypothetical protein [Natronomonas sp.]
MQLAGVDDIGAIHYSDIDFDERLAEPVCWLFQFIALTVRTP